MKRVVALDGVRGVAVGAVVLYHFGAGRPGWVEFRGGWAGVNLFFCLSGYLITCRLLDGQGVSDFYRRRFRRLVPAAVVMLSAWSVLALVAGHYSAGIVGFTWLSWATLSVNWVRASGANLPPLGHLWSLSVEEQFYLAWAPVVVWCRDRRLLLAGAVTGVVVSAVLSVLLPPVRVYYGTDTQAQSILVGVSLALCFRDRLEAGSLRWAGTLGLLLFALFVAVSGQNLVGSGAVVAATVISGLVVAGGCGGPACRILSSPGLRWLGRRSYAIYLFHFPLAQLATGRPAAVAVGCIALTLVLSELSWRVVESRFLARRPQLVGAA